MFLKNHLTQPADRVFANIAQDFTVCPASDEFCFSSQIVSQDRGYLINSGISKKSISFLCSLHNSLVSPFQALIAQDLSLF